MSRSLLRSLNETQARRVLAAGGVLVPGEGPWRLYRNGDTRRGPAGTVSVLIARRLMQEGLIGPAPRAAGRFIASPQLDRPSLNARAITADCLVARKPARHASLYARLIARGGIERGELLHMKVAAGRLLSDVRQTENGAAPSVQAAIGRLEALRTRLGTPVFRHLEALLVEEASERSFQRLIGDLKQRDDRASDTIALSALRALAQAYDLVGAAHSGR